MDRDARARVLLAEVQSLGLTLEDLLSASTGRQAGPSESVPTVAEYIERIRPAFTPEVWILDSDCVIARPDALRAPLATHPGAAIVGESQCDRWHGRVRHALYSLIVDPSALDRPEIATFTEGGDPAWEMLLSAERAGLAIADFPFTAGGTSSTSGAPASRQSTPRTTRHIRSTRGRASTTSPTTEASTARVNATNRSAPSSRAKSARNSTSPQPFEAEAGPWCHRGDEVFAVLVRDRLQRHRRHPEHRPRRLTPLQHPSRPSSHGHPPPALTVTARPQPDDGVRRHRLQRRLRPAPDPLPPSIGASTCPATWR